jgi:signal transduction histidine kinase
MTSRRSSNVRAKVVALLLSLAALWAFAAFVTVREGLNLLWLTTLDDNVGRPSEALFYALQQERRQSLVYIGGGTEAQRQALADRRVESDQLIAEYKRLAGGGAVQLAASPLAEQRINETFVQLDKLAEGRAAIDGGRVAGSQAAEPFTSALDSIFRMYDSLGELDDKTTAAEARTLTDLFRAQELLAQEDSLLAGVLAAGSFSGTQHADFVRLVGAQRFLFAEVAAELPEADRARYEQMLRDPAYNRYRLLEDRVVNQGRGGEPVPVGADEWSAAVEPVFGELLKLQTAGTDDLVARSGTVAIWVIVRLALAGVLGLIAVIASIIISITTARNLVRQLERLRNAAHDLAAYRLPRVVERLQHGEKVDVHTEAPPLDFGRDEIGQVGEAFNTVQETAIRVAVEQAELRRSVRDVFLSLARRSQALLHRQLGLLDAMERRATDAEELAELFRIDHLATRMRRNAENLIVLSGATAGRAWRKPVPMVDVLRGALAEVEDYTRVTVVPVGSASLLGRAVGDVIHLLAELVENAVSFSPPQTIVRIGGSVVGNGFAIEIEDRGLGMTFEEREAANEQLRNPPEFKLTSTARLGLYVVGKLAERHGIRVRLTESPYGGTTAIVLLPSTLIADGGADEVLRLDAGEADSTRPQRPVGGRHRNDAPALAGQTQTAVRGTPDLDLPLYSHVMQADLSNAVPTTPPREPAVSATAVVDAFAVDDPPVRPVGAERGAEPPSAWSPPPGMPAPTPPPPPMVSPSPPSSIAAPTPTPTPAPPAPPAPTRPDPADAVRPAVAPAARSGLAAGRYAVPAAERAGGGPGRRVGQWAFTAGGGRGRGPDAAPDPWPGRDAQPHGVVSVRHHART